MSTGEIKIFDNVVSAHNRNEIYSAVRYSKFSIGWGDSNLLETQQYQFLAARFEDEKRLELVKRVFIEGPLADELSGLSLVKSFVHLATPADSFFSHTHDQSKVLLYYVNPVWQDGWHGDTIFYEENCKDIRFCSPYTPGRCILFDGHIPHSLRPQSVIGPKYRFSLVMFFENSSLSSSG